MNILNTISKEIRNAFGFPQIEEVEQELTQKQNTPPGNYKVSFPDGEEDYSEYMGIGA